MKNNGLYNLTIGLTCGKDNCPTSLGWPSWVDCCVNATTTPPPTPAPTPSPSQPGDHDYCSSQNKCAENEGDCDSDSHCKSGLTCGKLYVFYIINYWFMNKKYEQTHFYYLQLNKNNIFHINYQNIQCSRYTSAYTHPLKMIPIPAMVYFINDPDSQRSGCGMGGPTTLEVGEAL